MNTYRIRLVGGLTEKRFLVPGGVAKLCKDGDIVDETFKKLYPTFCVGPVEEKLERLDGDVEVMEVVVEDTVEEEVVVEDTVEEEVVVEDTVDLETEGVENEEVIETTDTSDEIPEVTLDEDISLSEQVLLVESKDELATFVEVNNIVVTLRGNAGLEKQKEAVIKALA